MYEDILAGTRTRWDSRSGADFALCPACESISGSVASLLASLARALREPEVARAYEANPMLCCLHALETLRWCSPDEGALIVARLAERLAMAGREQLEGEPLLGQDRDRPARAVLRRRLRELARTLQDTERTAPLLAGLAARLDVHACPLCLAMGLTEQRSLGWAARESLEHADALLHDGFALCAQHLNDVFVDDPSAGTRLAGLQRDRALGRLLSLAASIEALPARTVRHRILRAVRAMRTQVPGGSWPRVHAATTAIFGSQRRGMRAVARRALDSTCFVCHAVARAEEREHALLLAALSDEPTARRFAASHGVCARHALKPWTLGVATPTVDPPSLVRQVVRARLAVMEWELTDANRRGAWPWRFDVARAGGCPWVDACALLDGRVRLGAPRAGSD